MPTAVGLDVRLLGQTSVTSAGDAVKLPKRATTFALLAYLIVHRAAPVARCLLAFTLFPDAEEEVALAELRRYLYLAQKALPRGESWILADGEIVRWNPQAPALIDVVEFERLVADPAHLQAAVDVYGGDLLPDIYDDWVVGERERLRARYVAALETLVHQGRSDRAYRAAIDAAKRLLVEEPWREDVVRQLMSARYESGDGAGALAEFERFVRSAREELRLEPMPETLVLRAAIVRGAALPSSLDAARRDDRRDDHALAFVGRGAQLERLHHAWSRAAHGQGGLVLVGGEPGIGKSRLVAELALAVEAEGGRVLSGSTGSPENAAYECVADVLRSALPLIATLNLDSLRCALLARLVPELGEYAERAEAPSVESGSERARLFEAVVRTLETLARGRPLLLVLEDLHWAGSATLELIRTLVRRAVRLPLLIVGTYRDHELGERAPFFVFERELVAERAALRVPIGRLNESDVRAALRAMPEFDAGDASALYAFSEGNPLFLVEMMREARSQATPVASLAHRLPVGIEGVVEARLGRLSEPTLRIAEVAAVVGASFGIDVVSDICGEARAEVLTAIDDLLDLHLVREAAGGRGVDYTFAHHLIAQAVYDRVDPDARSRRHGRAARVLIRRSGGSGEIARHYTAAGEHAAAAEWYARGAFEAAQLFAHEDAIAFATAALDAGMETEATVPLMLLREAARGQIGRRTEQLADLASLEKRTDGRLFLDVLRREIDVFRALDDGEREDAAIVLLSEAAIRQGEPRWNALATYARARQRSDRGDYAEARRLAERALEELDRSGDMSERFACMAVTTDALAALGEIDAAASLLERSLGMAREQGDPRAMAAVLMQSAAVAMAAQHFDVVVRASTEALESFRAVGDRVGEARALANLATASIRLSRFEAARVANIAAADIFESIGDRRGVARVWMNLAMLHGRCGDLVPARALLGRARELQAQLGDARGETAASINESFIALWQGRAGEARELARRAVEAATRIGHAAYVATALGNEGAACRDLGELAEAIELMERGIEAQVALGRLPDAVSDLADLALALAQSGAMDAALRRVDEVLAIDRAWTASAIFPPYPLWLAARVLHAAGDPRVAAVLDETAEITRRFVASIDAPDLRGTFEGLRFVEEIALAKERDCWPSLR